MSGIVCRRERPSRVVVRLVLRNALRAFEVARSAPGPSALRYFGVTSPLTSGFSCPAGVPPCAVCVWTGPCRRPCAVGFVFRKAHH